MNTFVMTIFWLFVVVGIFRIINLATGSYLERSSIGIYAADTVLYFAFAVWAGFTLWH